MRYLILALGGCATTVATVPPAHPPLVAIRQITFLDDGVARMRLAPNGNLELVVRRTFDAGNSTFENRFAGTLAADGSFADPHGALAGRLESDGTFHTTSGVAPFKLVGEDLVVGDQRLAIDDRGGLLRDGKSFMPKVRVEGAVDATTRRTALLVFAIAQSMSLSE